MDGQLTTNMGIGCQDQWFVIPFSYIAKFILWAKICALSQTLISLVNCENSTILVAHAGLYISIIEMILAFNYALLIAS